MIAGTSRARGTVNATIVDDEHRILVARTRGAVFASIGALLFALPSVGIAWGLIILAQSEHLFGPSQFAAPPFPLVLLSPLFLALAVPSWVMCRPALSEPGARANAVLAIVLGTLAGVSAAVAFGAIAWTTRGGAT